VNESEKKFAPIRFDETSSNLHLFPLLNSLAYRMSWLGSIFSSIPTTTSQDPLQDDATSTLSPPQQPLDNTIRVAILLDGDADYVNILYSLISSK